MTHQSLANGMNDRGQVVGNGYDGNTMVNAFVWQSGRMTGLGNLSGRSGGPYNDSSAEAINNRGRIVGWSGSKSGRDHAVMWTRR
jgi:probable HAF family extracellular repeat protein